MSKRPRGHGTIFRQRGSRYWWIGYSFNGKYLRESSESEKRSEAERLLSKRLAEIQMGKFAGPEAERVKVSELAEGLLVDYRINRKSAEWAEMVWRVHLLPFFGATLARAVSTDLLNRYVEERRARGIANGTINRELAMLRRMFYLGLCSTPPKVLRVPNFPRLTEAAPRRGFVDRAEYDRLAANASPLWLRAMLATAYTFGFRKGELLSMRVQQVDLLNRTIRLDPGTTKNNEGRVVKMTAEVYTLLTACVAGKQPEAFVFTRSNGLAVRDFRGEWAKLTRAAGLPDLLFHDLRRSAVRNMVRAGIAERVAMAISGHKTRSVFERYNIVSETDLADAARRIEQQPASMQSSYIAEGPEPQPQAKAVN